MKLSKNKITLCIECTKQVFFFIKFALFNISCVVFVALQVMSELFLNMQMLQVIYSVPTQASPILQGKVHKVERADPAVHDYL